MHRDLRLRLAAIAGLLVFAWPTHAGADVEVSVLSNRADLISDGNALVAIGLPRGTRPEDVTVSSTAGGETRDITPFFAKHRGGLEGLVEGLRLGPNDVTATLAGVGSDSITIVNHPNGGPVFSGPQVQPWQCQDTAQDASCNQPAEYEFIYKSTDPTSPGLQPYDPDDPPSDVATTTTDEGVEVPFIVRIETGYQDRDQYKIATLFQPGEPWQPWAPQEQWNHKLLITHGASCGITHETGTAPSVTGDTIGVPGGPGVGNSPETALARGFAVMSTALDNAGHNCNIATQAESLVMAKERLVEQYGRIRYTIGTGCSGGSLTQQQVANAYPGIYQGILPQCSYPDAISTGIQFADYHLLRLYFEDVAARLPGLWVPAQWGLVEGHLSHANAVTADEAFFKTATEPSGDCVPPEVVYDPVTNPGGVRCSVLDYMINVFGPRPEALWTPQEQAAGRGFAGIPLGNVGVQYGLGALQAGAITPEQFVDLNHEVGGLDIDIDPVPDRIPGDRNAIRNAYRSGAINEANNLDRVAIIDLRGPDPAIAHDAYRSWELRARLDREHGTHANQVIWFGPTPLIGDANYTTEGLLAMDRWLAAVEADRSRRPLAEKIIEDKPADVQDRCEPDGVVVSEACELVIGPLRYGTPRTVAGDALTTDNAACRLTRLERSDYGSITFTDEQWLRLQAAFPKGVCDYSRPGIGQQNTIAWQRYQGADGSAIYGGEPMGAAPAGSGGGWAASSFKSWLRP